MLQRLLLLWLILLSLLAYFWPKLWEEFVLRFGVPTSFVFDPFRQTNEAGLLKPIFGLTMFSIGCLLPRDEIAQVVRKWPSVFGGTAVQYACMPLLAFLVGRGFRLESAEMVGVVMVGCVPGAMASNVLTLAARGNVSYSVSLTTSATLLSPLAVPLALWLLLGSRVRLDPLQVSLDLLMIVVGPVVGGHLLSRSSRRFRSAMHLCGPVAANLAILWIIAVVVGLNRQRLGEVGLLLLSGLLTINLLGYAAGYAGGKVLRLPDSMRRALTLEVGMQNAGLGTVLVLDLFPDNPESAIPTAAYTFGCMLTGTILAQIWARRASKQATVQTHGEAD